VKVALAARLRAETTMMVGWIADHMAMGTRDYLNHLVYRRRKLGGELTISRTDPFSPFSRLPPFFPFSNSATNWSVTFFPEGGTSVGAL